MTGVFKARNAKAMFAKTFAKTPPKTIARAFGHITVKLVSITNRVTAHPPSAPAPMATNPAAAHVMIGCCAARMMLFVQIVRIDLQVLCSWKMNCFKLTFPVLAY